MVATYPVLSLLVVFGLSLVVIRVGSVALEMAGLSPDVASFQATSAFTGAGFTTEEAEYTVSTPERRTIVKALIRLGNIGLVSAIASLVLSFTNAAGENAPSLVAIVAGIGVLVLAARSRWLNRLLTPFFEWALSRTTGLELRDYTRMLGLQGDYRVAEIGVEADDWLAEATPTELDLAAEGVRALGIRRDEDYIGAPGPDVEIRPGDTVVLYGKEDRLQELSGRESGDHQAHEDAVEEHEEDLEAQEELIEDWADRPAGCGES